MQNKKLFVLAMMLSCSVFAAEQQTTQSVPAISDQRHLNNLIAQIKSLDDLNAYMHNTPKAKNPIEKLSPNGKTRFLSGLKFGEKGLASFNYMDLVSELTASEIYQILSLFGMQEYMPTTNLVIKNDIDTKVIQSIKKHPDDRENYECIKPGHCKPRIADICTYLC